MASAFDSSPCAPPSCATHQAMPWLAPTWMTSASTHGAPRVLYLSAWHLLASKMGVGALSKCSAGEPVRVPRAGFGVNDQLVTALM